MKGDGRKRKTEDGSIEEKKEWYSVCGTYVVTDSVKGKAIPLQGLDRPWGLQEVEAPGFQDNRHLKAVRLSALRTGRLYPRGRYFWYSFLLEAELTIGPQCGRKDYVNGKFQWHQRESNPRPSGLYRSASANRATACPYWQCNCVICRSWADQKLTF